MTVQAGDKVPEATLYEMRDRSPQAVTTGELFGGRKVVVFALPGAFTPTCSNHHLPGFINHADEIKAKGVDEIVCLSVNDAFVMGAWGDDQKTGSAVRMLADGSADFTRKLGLELDLSERGFGVRSQRYAMLVDNGIVSAINVEEGGKFEVSSAEAVLQLL